MMGRYYGERKTVKQGGSIRLTIPSDAVSDLDIEDGHYIGVFGEQDVLMLVLKGGCDGRDGDAELS